MGNTIESCCCSCVKEETTDGDEVKTELSRGPDPKFDEKTMCTLSPATKDLDSFELHSVDLSGEEDKENGEEGRQEEEEEPEKEVEDVLTGLNWFSRLQIEVLSLPEKKKRESVVARTVEE